MVQELVRPAKLPRGAAPDSAWAYLDGKFLPIREAKISVMTHGFNYGTGVFEGIRAYWNAEEEQLRPPPPRAFRPASALRQDHAHRGPAHRGRARRHLR